MFDVVLRQRVSLYARVEDGDPSGDTEEFQAADSSLPLDPGTAALFRALVDVFHESRRGSDRDSTTLQAFACARSRYAMLEEGTKHRETAECTDQATVVPAAGREDADDVVAEVLTFLASGNLAVVVAHRRGIEVGSCGTARFERIRDLWLRNTGNQMVGVVHRDSLLTLVASYDVARIADHA